MKYKKIIFLVLLIILLFILIICCKEQLSGEITFWGLPIAPEYMYDTWVEKKCIEFKKKTTVTVKYKKIGWQDAWIKISTALSLGEGPDVIQVGTTWNPQFAATGSLLELDINEFGGKNDFIKPSLESCSYKGKYYGIPWFVETRCLFYNKKMFKEANVQPPRTHEELVEVGKKLVQKHGKEKGISIVGIKEWDLLHNWAFILWGNGGDILNENNTKAVFNSSEGINAMKWYINLYQEEIAPKGYRNSSAVLLFVNEEVGMCYINPWGVVSIMSGNPDLQYGIVEPPIGSIDRKVSFLGGCNLAILSNSANKNASKAFVKHMVDLENLIDCIKNLTGMLPARIKAYKDPYYQKGDMKIFKNTLEYARAYPPISVWGSIENVIVDELNNILIDYYTKGEYSEDTIKMYLDKAAQEVDVILREEM